MGRKFGWTTEDVEKYKYLGRGGLGVVYFVNYSFYFKNYLVQMMRLPNNIAVKKAMKGANAWQKYNHPNIIKIHAAEMDTGRMLMIWLEYCSSGDLDHYMRNKNPGMKEIISVMTQLCDAVQYLHSKGVTHKDIKPSNIILVGHWWAYPTVKLADFGIGKFAESISNVEQIYLNTPLGVPPYAAPEVIAKESYTESADVYSLGRVLEDLIYFGRKTLTETLGLNVLSEQMKDLDPSSRPSVIKVKQFLERGADISSSNESLLDSIHSQ